MPTGHGRRCTPTPTPFQSRSCPVRTQKMFKARVEYKSPRIKCVSPCILSLPPRRYACYLKVGCFASPWHMRTKMPCHASENHSGVVSVSTRPEQHKQRTNPIRTGFQKTEPRVVLGTGKTLCKFRQIQQRQRADILATESNTNLITRVCPVV